MPRTRSYVASHHQSPNNAAISSKRTKKDQDRFKKTKEKPQASGIKDVAVHREIIEGAVSVRMKEGAGNGELEDGAGLEEMKDGAGLEEMKNGAGLEEMKDGAGLEEMKEGAGLEEMKDVAGHGEMKDGAGLEEMKDGAGLEEMKEGAGHGEMKDGAGLEEMKDVAGHGEMKDGAGLEEMKEGAGHGEMEDGAGLEEMEDVAGHEDMADGDVQGGMKKGAVNRGSEDGGGQHREMEDGAACIDVGVDVVGHYCFVTFDENEAVPSVSVDGNVSETLQIKACNSQLESRQSCIIDESGADSDVSEVIPLPRGKHRCFQDNSAVARESVPCNSEFLSVLGTMQEDINTPSGYTVGNQAPCVASANFGSSVATGELDKELAAVDRSNIYMHTQAGDDGSGMDCTEAAVCGSGDGIASNDDSMDCSDGMDTGSFTDDDSASSIFFPPVVKDSSTNKRTYNKHQACFYCSKLVTKISKHLLTQHKDRQEVKDIQEMRVGSKERAQAFELLRNRGNYFHNKMVYDLKQGEIIFVRRPRSSGYACENSEYGPCPDCLGFYLKAELWKHLHYFCCARKDESNTDVTPAKRRSRDIRLESALLMDEFTEASPVVKAVLAGMRQDHLSKVVQNDPLIIQLGNAHARKTFGMDPQRRRHYLSQEMRNVGRLLLNLQSLSKSSSSLNDFIAPQQFDTVVRGVQLTAGQLEHDNLMTETERPSLALKLGHSLAKLGAMKRCLALRRSDTEAEQEAENFLKLKDAEWAEHISSEVLKTMFQRKHDKVVELPESTDVKVFAEFLQENIKTATSKLKKQASAANYRRCSELVLARLTTFNKRRAGEMEQLQLKSYTTRPDWNKASITDIQKSLSPLERHLMKEIDMVYTRGKRGRRVPILIPVECKKAMEQLVTCRDVCGIPSNNPYFFGRRGCLSNIRATDCLRQLAQEAKLEKPHLVRTTKVRKYTATISQILDLKESQLDWLADHLGHSIQIHRDYYRLSAPTVELTKIAKLLLAIETGKIGQFVGKSLDEIHLEDIHVEDDGSDIDDDDDEGSAHDPEPGTQATSSRSRSTKESSDRQKKQPSGSAHDPEPGTQTTSSRSRSTKESSDRQKKQPSDSSHRKLWSKVETRAVWKELHDFIKREKIPGKADCEECIKQADPILNKRSWRDIKYKVKTIVTQVKRDKAK